MEGSNLVLDVRSFERISDSDIYARTVRVVREVGEGPRSGGNRLHSVSQGLFSKQVE